MGPLVPHFIGNELNLIIALLVGVGFGFFLEQAGFSSTKKLVGLFYGYDFTVLKVFFTAGVTAMIGVIFLAHYNLLNLNLIYVNPTFLYSALVGGAIMGVGFIIGGFCPGTSVCAAAVGKLDGLAFVGGSVLGIVIFSVFYPQLENLYLAKSMGAVTIFEQLGISRNSWAISLTVIAIGAFYATWLIENKVNKRKPKYAKINVRNYTIAGVLAAVFIALVAFTPNRTEIIESRILKGFEENQYNYHEISADKLANEIVNNYYKLNIIDVRSKEAYNTWHLPLAIHVPSNEILNREWEAVFRQNIKTNVFYADTEKEAKLAYLKSKYAGKSNNFVLDVPAKEFKEIFFNRQNIDKPMSKDSLTIYYFREDAARQMEEIEESLKNINKPVKKVAKKAAGGCS